MAVPAAFWHSKCSVVGSAASVVVHPTLRSNPTAAQATTGYRNNMTVNVKLGRMGRPLRRTLARFWRNRQGGVAICQPEKSP